MVGIMSVITWTPGVLVLDTELGRESGQTTVIQARVGVLLPRVAAGISLDCRWRPSGPGTHRLGAPTIILWIEVILQRDPPYAHNLGWGRRGSHPGNISSSWYVFSTYPPRWKLLMLDRSYSICEPSNSNSSLNFLSEIHKIRGDIFTSTCIK